MITVRNSVGKRNNYFLAADTEFREGDRTLTLDNIKRGQEVTLNLRQMDTGPEIVLFDVLNAEELVDVIPVELSEVIDVSGTVTGVRPVKGTLTVRDSATRDRRTFMVNDQTSIKKKDGETLNLRKINRGDQVTLRGRQTEQGFVLVSAVVPLREASMADTEMADTGMLADTLPKTATTNYLFLFLGLGFAAIGTLLWRRKA